MFMAYCHKAQIYVFKIYPFCRGNQRYAKTDYLIAIIYIPESTFSAGEVFYFAIHSWYRHTDALQNTSMEFENATATALSTNLNGKNNKKRTNSKTNHADLWKYLLLPSLWPSRIRLIRLDLFPGPAANLGRLGQLERSNRKRIYCPLKQTGTEKSPLLISLWVLMRARPNWDQHSIISLLCLAC